MLCCGGFFYIVLSSRDNRAMGNVYRTLDESILVDEIYGLIPEELLREVRRYHPDRVFAWGSRPTEGNLRLGGEYEGG